MRDAAASVFLGMPKTGVASFLPAPTRTRATKRDLVLAGLRIGFASRDQERLVAAGVVLRGRLARGVVRVAAAASRSSECSTELTAALEGNAAATSGSSTTMLEPLAMRGAYLPRTNPCGKSDA